MKHEKLGISNKIRSLRKKRGLTLQELADHTGLSKGYLSRIERMHQAPPVFTLQKIAHALGIDIGEFFSSGTDSSAVSENLDIVKHEEQDIESKENDYLVYEYIPLLKSFKDKYMWPVIVKVRTGKTEFFTHDSEEFVYVLKGPVHFFYEDGEHMLETGDAFYFDSRLPHAFQNDENEEAILLGVNFNYRRY